MSFQQKFSYLSTARKLFGGRVVRYLYAQIAKDPYRPWFDETQSIFIHIPKCAGMSVQKNLYGVAEPVGHFSIINYQLYDETKYRSYFKYTFVRDPLDRFESAYNFLRNGGISSADRSFASDYVLPYRDIHEFVNSLKRDSTRKRVLDWIHFRPQYLFLVDLASRVRLDFVGKVESFDEDLERIADRLGKDLRPIEAVNRTPRTVETQILTKAEKDFVSELYARDIETFRY